MILILPGFEALLFGPPLPDPCRTAGKRAGNDAKNGLVDSLNDDFTKLRGESR